MDREIQVYADWNELKHPRLMGALRAIETKGKEVYTFSYNDEWLKSSHKQTLDPDLQFFKGPQYLKDDRPNFGMFLDSSPDRWGEVLMHRREAEFARLEGRPPKRLMRSDYLLGVHDAQRLGALRFSLEEGGVFQNDNAAMSAPPSTSLRELEHASWTLQDENQGGEDMIKWLNLLIAPGSSLGGARPKAGVQYPNGDYWIAKFPGRNDEHDTGAWEWITWNLAKSAGLDLPRAEILRLDTKRHHTFASQRFDRVPGTRGEKRIHFASAMTLLGYNDGASHAEGVSYLELIDFLSNQGASVVQDLRELWRRIVFSICVSNTDDHLRNHGFLLTKSGWRLAPAYDINPNPLGHGLSLNINEDENRLSLDLAREIAEFCRLKPDDAEKIIGEVKSAVGQWRAIASQLGVSRASQESMAPSFEMAKETKAIPAPGLAEFWISQSGKRHNQACRFYKATTGHWGTTTEGTPCSLCGG